MPHLIKIRILSLTSISMGPQLDSKGIRILSTAPWLIKWLNVTGKRIEGNEVGKWLSEANFPIVKIDLFNKYSGSRKGSKASLMICSKMKSKEMR